MDTVALRDVALSLQDGPFGSNLKSSHYVDNGVRVVRLQNIAPGYFDDRDRAFVTEEHFARLKKHECQQGDVLIATLGDPIVRACLQPPWLEKALHKADCLRLRCDPDRVLPKYIVRFLNSDALQSQAMGLAHGQTRPRVNLGQLGAVRVPLPPLAEQRRIADILDQADALRSARRSNIASLSDLVIAAFEARFTEAELAERVPLTRALAVSPSYGTMIPPAETGGFLSLRVKNIQNASLDLSDRKYVDLPPKELLRHSVQDGDLLMARAIGSLDHLGKCIVAYPGDERWAFDSHLMRIRLDPQIMIPEFLRVWLLTPAGRASFLRIARRSAVQHNVNTKEIAAFPVPMPPNSKQRAYVDTLHVIEAERGRMSRSLAHLDGLFQSLQYRAFDGKL